MKLLKALSISVIATIVGLVNADVDYFTIPRLDQEVYDAGSIVKFKVAQLPDIDQQTVFANVYPEGQQELVMTIQQWAASSFDNNNKNNFQFDWQVPNDLRPGRYYVKIDVNNDQDDNDICRSKTFIIQRSTEGVNAAVADVDSLGNNGNIVNQPNANPAQNTNHEGARSMVVTGGPAPQYGKSYSSKLAGTRLRRFIQRRSQSLSV